MDPYSWTAFLPTSCHRNAFDKKLRSYHFNSEREKNLLYMDLFQGLILICVVCAVYIINIWAPTADLHSFQHPVIGTHLTKNCFPTTSIPVIGTHLTGKLKKLFIHVLMGFISRSVPDLCCWCCSNVINIWAHNADLHYFQHPVIGTHLTKSCIWHNNWVPTTSIQGVIKFDLASFQGHTSISPSSAPSFPDYADFLPPSDFQPSSAMFQSHMQHTLDPISVYILRTFVAVTHN